MHLLSSKMGEPQGPTGKGAESKKHCEKAGHRTLHRCSRVVEGGEQRWKKVCKGRSSDQLVRIKTPLWYRGNITVCESLNNEHVPIDLNISK